MRTHELANFLLSLPDSDLEASIEVDSKVKDSHGDVITAHGIASSIVDVYSRKSSPFDNDNNTVVIQFEQFDDLKAQDSSISITGVVNKAATAKFISSM